MLPIIPQFDDYNCQIGGRLCLQYLQSFLDCRKKTLTFLIPDLIANLTRIKLEKKSLTCILDCTFENVQFTPCPSVLLNSVGLAKKLIDSFGVKFTTGTHHTLSPTFQFAPFNSILKILDS